MHRYRNLLTKYLEGQSHTYLLVGIFFLEFPQNWTITLLGAIFCGTSFILLISPLCTFIRNVSLSLNTIFEFGLAIGSIFYLIMNDLLPKLGQNQNTIISLPFLLLGWLVLFVTVEFIKAIRHIGFMKVVSFGSLSYGGLEFITGNQSTIVLIIIGVGATLSIPVLNEIWYGNN